MILSARDRVASTAMPNLIVIGAGRCGTTSLHNYLGCHPEIGMSATKELNFFSGALEPAADPPLADPIDAALRSRNRGTWSRGLNWYQAQFDARFAVRGESSPAYSSPWRGRACAQRIREHLTSVRLIYCIRDPLDCAVSHYRLRRRAGDEAREIDAALHPGSFYAHACRMALRLEPYLDLFGPEAIHIVERNDLAHRRRDTLRGVFGFLGVNEEYWVDDFQRRWDPASATRLARATRRLRQHASVRRLPLRRFSSASRLLYEVTHRDEQSSRPEPSPETRARLAEVLAPDADRLRHLTGLELSAWSV